MRHSAEKHFLSQRKREFVKKLLIVSQRKRSKRNGNLIFDLKIKTKYFQIWKYLKEKKFTELSIKEYIEGKRNENYRRQGFKWMKILFQLSKNTNRFNCIEDHLRNKSGRTFLETIKHICIEEKMSMNFILHYLKIKYLQKSLSGFRMQMIISNKKTHLNSLTEKYQSMFSKKRFFRNVR